MKFKTYSINEYLEGLDNDYKSINSIVINRFNFLKEIVPVCLEELKYLEGLRELTLCNLYIDQDSLEIIGNLNLIKLELINCELTEEFSNMINSSKLKDLTLDNSYFNLGDLNCNLEKLTVINMPFNNCNINIKHLDLSRADIDVNHLEFGEIDNLIISIKQYANNKNYFDTLNDIINIIVKDDVRDDLGDSI